MSNATIHQHPNEQSGGRPLLPNGLEPKNDPRCGDELESTYMHQGSMNQAYGIAATSDSYMPSYYGHMAYPYVGSEWSSASDSIPYLTGYGGEAQQQSYMPDPLFNQPHTPLGTSQAYFNQPCSYFPANNDFSAWASPSSGHGVGLSENAPGAGIGPQSTPAYNGDYYSVMPASPQDYLGRGELLPSGNNILRQNAAMTAVGVSSVGVMSSGDGINKTHIDSPSNGINMVEKGFQNMGLGVSSMGTDSLKQQTTQNPMHISGGLVGVSGSGQSVISGNNISGSIVHTESSNTDSSQLTGSNAPKPVSWAAIASKPAKPQPKPKTKISAGSGLPPPIKHNMDIGTWDGTTPSSTRGPNRGQMTGQHGAPQRWSSPRQSAVGHEFGNVIQDQGADMHGQTSQSMLTPDSFEDTRTSKTNDMGSAVLEKLKSENDYNPKRLTLDVRNARFFVIKSYSEDDIHRSIKYNIWCSTEHGNKRLDAAFRAQQGRGPVILLYSVNSSGHFCGVAEMLTSIDYSKRAGVWAQDKWKGKFQVKWIYAKDVPNSVLRHIRLENNENKPVTNSRDTQEVPAEKGRQVLKIISNYKHQTSIFDDFSHYERRQVEEEGQRAKRNDQRARENMRRSEKTLFQQQPPQNEPKN